MPLRRELQTQLNRRDFLTRSRSPTLYKAQPSGCRQLAKAPSSALDSALGSGEKPGEETVSRSLARRPVFRVNAISREYYPTASASHGVPPPHPDRPSIVHRTCERPLPCILILLISVRRDLLAWRVPFRSISFAGHYEIRGFETDLSPPREAISRGNSSEIATVHVTPRSNLPSKNPI